MKDIEAIAEDIVAREGGYVNDPDDLGGATKHGVTLGTLKRLGLDIDDNGRVDEADVKRLDKATAVRVFLEHYFHRPRIAELPDMLHASVFDMYVNAGSHAVKILQRLIGQMGEPIAVDGLIGPQTVGAVRRAAGKAPDHLVDAYGIARREYYYSLADSRPASRKYARRRDGGKGGWITRAEAFVSPRFHLTDAQHRARVALWG